MGENRQRDGGRGGSCYWAAATLWVNISAERTCACAFAIADFIINPARVGTQTHIDLMDLFRLPPCPDWEPMAMRTKKATVNSAKRLMG